MSVILREARQGYDLDRSTSGKINHLLYMDDLKLYGKSKSELESLVQTVRIFTGNIKMRFGIQKCATIVMKRGKKEEDDGILLPDGQIMHDLGNENYKYLRVLKADKVKMNEMKDMVTKIGSRIKTKWWQYYQSDKHMGGCCPKIFWRDSRLDK